MNAHIIKYALTIVRIMNNQLSKLILNIVVIWKASGFSIPNQTSTIVIRDNIPKTFQILPVFDS
jgi:hypothetical protein